MIDNEEIIVQEILTGSKYRNLSVDCIRRIVHDTYPRYDKQCDIVKAAKKKLHQISGAFLDERDKNRVKHSLTRFQQSLFISDTKELCKELLLLHVSTKERKNFIDRLYTDIFTVTGKPDSIIDIACGFTPFSIPLMELNTESSYYAYDMDCSLIAMLNEFFSLLGMNAIACCQDVLLTLPALETDIVFIFKSLPVFEQQKPGTSTKIIRNIRSKYITVSFPAQSIGGKEKGMRNFYYSFLKNALGEMKCMIEQVSYATEDFYIIKK